MKLIYSYTDQKTLNEEPLPFIHFIAIKLRGKSSIVQKFRYGSAGYGTVLNVLQIIVLIYEGSAAFFRIPLTCIYLYITFSQLSLTFLMDVESLRNQKKEVYWSLNGAGCQVKKQILESGKFMDTLAILAFSLFLMCEPILSLGELRETDFSCTLCRRYLPWFENVHVTIIGLWTLVATPVFLGWPFTYIYFSYHLQYQLMMLAEYVREISSDFDEYTFTNDLRHDEHYQNLILKRLKFVIRRHGELLRCHRQSLKYYKSEMTALLLGFCGSTIAISSCWAMMINDNPMKPLLVLSSFLIILEMQTRTGQSIQEMFAGIYEASLQVPWYQWDINNRKIYSSLVQISTRMVPSSFFNINVNREFQLKLLSKVYAMTSLLLDFQFNWK